MAFIILFIMVELILLVTLRLYEKNWNKRLEVSVKFDRDHVTEEESCFVTEKVINRKYLPMPALNIKFQLDRSIDYKEKENTAKSDKQYRCDCVALMPYQCVTRSFEVYCRQRGYFSIDKIGLVATDLFYTNILSDELANKSFLYVYPKRSEFPCVRESYHRIQGEVISKRFLQEDPFTFRGVREYTPLDSMKKINWKASAKTSSLKVNQFFDTTSQEVVLFLNLGQDGMLVYEHLLEEAIRMVRNYLEWFIQDGIHVKVVSNGVDLVTHQQLDLRDGHGTSHMDYCLRQLSRVTYKETLEPMADMLHRFRKLQQAKENHGMAILVSVEQSDAVCQAFDDFVGQEKTGYMLIPTYADLKKNMEQKDSAMSKMKHVSVKYLEVGRS